MPPASPSPSTTGSSASSRQLALGTFFPFFVSSFSPRDRCRKGAGRNEKRKERPHSLAKSPGQGDPLLPGAAPADIFRVEDIGFWGPDLLIFHGRTGNDEPFRSMQHISQLNIQLVGVKKTAEEPRRIGFVLIDKIDKDAS